MPIKKRYVGNVRDLKVYRKALIFRKIIYGIVKTLPEHENDNLGDIFRKSSCSIVSNISEGNTNFYCKKEYSHLNMALSKLAECRSALDIARMEGYVNDVIYEDADGKAEEVLKMIIGMMNRIDRQVEREKEEDETEPSFEKSISPVVLKELIEKATAFHDSILSIVEQYPETEKNNQNDQIVRASKSSLQSLHFSNSASPQQIFLNLNTALGSMSECRAFITIARMENFISDYQYQETDKLAGTILEKLIDIMSQVE